MEKLLFPILAIDGNNYISWALNAETHLNCKGLGETIITDANHTLQTKAQASALLRHHLAEKLQLQYLMEYNPRLLWDALKARFEHMKTISLPAARHDWINLRVQDYPSIATYNSELFRITSQLAVCGHPINDAEQIERTLSTFPPTN